MVMGDVHYLLPCDLCISLLVYADRPFSRCIRVAKGLIKDEEVRTNHYFVVAKIHARPPSVADTFDLTN